MNMPQKFLSRAMQKVVDTAFKMIPMRSRITAWEYAFFDAGKTDLMRYQALQQMERLYGDFIAAKPFEGLRLAFTRLRDRPANAFARAAEPADDGEDYYHERNQNAFRRCLDNIFQDHAERLARVSADKLADSLDLSVRILECDAVSPAGKAAAINAIDALVSHMDAHFPQMKTDRLVRKAMANAASEDSEYALFAALKQARENNVRHAEPKTI